MLVLIFLANLVVVDWLDAVAAVVLLLLATTLGFLLLACAAARRPIGERGKPSVKPLDDPAALKRRVRWPYYLVDPLKRLAPVPDGSNALAIQEPRIIRSIARVGGIRGVYIILIPSLCLTLKG